MSVRVLAIVSIVLSVACFASAGGPSKKLISGPQAGATLPGPFDARVVSGEFKGKQHCLVCENRLFPAVMVVVREPEPPREWKDDGPIMELLTRLDEMAPRHESAYLKSFVVFLGPHAHTSATSEGKKSAKELVDEAKNRELFIKRLAGRAEKLKHVVVAAFPKEGPKDYKFSTDAEATLIFFNQLKVLTNAAYPEGAMTNEDAARFLDEVEKTIKSWKKK